MFFTKVFLGLALPSGGCTVHPHPQGRADSTAVLHGMWIERQNNDVLISISLQSSLLLLRLQQQQGFVSPTSTSSSRSPSLLQAAPHQALQSSPSPILFCSMEVAQRSKAGNTALPGSLPGSSKPGSVPCSLSAIQMDYVPCNAGALWVKAGTCRCSLLECSDGLLGPTAETAVTELPFSSYNTARDASSSFFIPIAHRNPKALGRQQLQSAFASPAESEEHEAVSGF